MKERKIRVEPSMETKVSAEAQIEDRSWTSMVRQLIKEALERRDADRRGTLRED